MRSWKTCWTTPFRDGAHGARTGGRRSWSGWRGKCGPVQTTSWGQIVVFSGMWLSSSLSFTSNPGIRRRGGTRLRLTARPHRLRLPSIQIPGDRVDLYRHIPPPYKKILVSVDPLQVGDSVPTQEEIEWSLRRLKNNRSCGPSGMRA